MRNGNAQQIMSLSKENTTALWNAVRDSAFIPCYHPPSDMCIPGATTRDLG